MIAAAERPAVSAIRADARVFDSWDSGGFTVVALRPGFSFGDRDGVPVHTVYADCDFKARLWLFCALPCSCNECLRRTIIKPTH